MKKPGLWSRMFSWVSSKLKRVMSEKVRISFLQAFPFWIASVCGGLIAVGYTLLFSSSERLFHYLVSFGPWAILIISPITFLLAWWLVQRYAPYAKGSGIPQVMAAIELSGSKNDRKVYKLLSLRILVIKIVSSLLMVVGGAPIGREGPTIQVSASVFRFISKIIPASWPKLSEKNFILTGASAGLAAAFNTPLGGIVFAIEELAREHISFFRTALFSAVIISGLAAQAILGPYLYLGYPDIKNLDPWIIGYVSVGAIICGCFGASFGKIIAWCVAWKSAIGKFKTVLLIIITAWIIGLIGFYVNPDMFGSGKEVLISTLFDADKSVSWSTMLFRFIGPVLVFNVGASGGIFAPSLAAGAAIGSSVAEMFGMLDGNANMLILTGMVGFLTGVTRSPFTSAIIVLEMTDRHSVIFYLMIAALLSNLAALLIEKHSLYDNLKRQYLQDLTQ